LPLLRGSLNLAGVRRRNRDEERVGKRDNRVGRHGAAIDQEEECGRGQNGEVHLKKRLPKGVCTKSSNDAARGA